MIAPQKSPGPEAKLLPGRTSRSLYLCDELEAVLLRVGLRRRAFGAVDCELCI